MIFIIMPMRLARIMRMIVMKFVGRGSGTRRTYRLLVRALGRRRGRTQCVSESAVAKPISLIAKATLDCPARQQASSKVSWAGSIPVNRIYRIAIRIAIKVRLSSRE
jgi:hypothetical protein